MKFDNAPDTSDPVPCKTDAGEASDVRLCPVPTRAAQFLELTEIRREVLQLLHLIDEPLEH